jgi:hypothetical protein
MPRAEASGFRGWIFLASLSYGTCLALLLVVVGIAANLNFRSLLLPYELLAELDQASVVRLGILSRATIMSYFVPFILPGVALASTGAYITARQRRDLD